MDIDAFSAVRQTRWERLRELARKRRRTGAEADEMTALYRSTAADLSTVRSVAPDPALMTRLSIILAQSRVWLTGSHTFRPSDAARYFTRSLPAALYRSRWWSAGTGLIVVALAALSAYHTLNTPGALDLVGPPELRAQIAQEEFASYYWEYDNTSFVARVWTNNAWLAAQCFIFALTGFFVVYLMYNTVLQLGVAAAVMAEHGQLDIFFQLISPHGLLELSAVFIAAGTSLRLFWTMLVPGARTRGQALAQEGRNTVGVILGTTILLFISGLLEGYITPSSLPWSVKVAIGATAFVAAWIYIFGVGRAAVSWGATGEDSADFRTAEAPVAA